MSKIRVGIIFGGRSAEHEVSLQSAKNVIAAIDRDKYKGSIIGLALERFEKQSRLKTGYDL